MFCRLCYLAEKESNKKFLQVQVKRDGNCLFYSIAVGINYLHERKVLSVDEATTKGTMIRNHLYAFVDKNVEEDFCVDIIEKAFTLGEFEVERREGEKTFQMNTVAYNEKYEAYLKQLQNHKKFCRKHDTRFHVKAIEREDWNISGKSRRQVLDEPRRQSGGMTPPEGVGFI